MITIRPSRPEDVPRAVEIWCTAVDATHDFLTPVDRATIGEEVAGFLPDTPMLLAVDAQGHALGFMALDDDHMEALFIDPAARGTGIGRTLVEHALARHPRLTTDVNEQNAQAVGFYQRMGFAFASRSARDGEGRPYPVLHLRHRGTPASQRGGARKRSRPTW
ncbi:MAG: acetyltransferase [Sphingobium sp.]